MYLWTVINLYFNSIEITMIKKIDLVKSKFINLLFHPY